MVVIPKIFKNYLKHDFSIYIEKKEQTYNQFPKFRHQNQQSCQNILLG